MKFRILTLLIITSSCTDQSNLLDTNDLIGQWQLSEVLADPGDGSGTFQPVDSDKTIAFRLDNTYESNGAICKTDAMTGKNIGTYDPEKQIINSPGCSPDAFRDIGYDLKDGHLFIYYPCIEPCAQKFVKISDSSIDLKD